MSWKTIAALGALAVALLATPALATPPDGASGVVLARSVVDEKVKIREEPGTELVSQVITIAPGGNTGWHTHPGAALAIVSQGSLTVTRVMHTGKHGARCETVAYPAGKAFVDPGHGHVHIARNLGTVPAEVRVTYTGVPVGGAFRIDAADPGC
jgi:quercetin dioxygenase-like cupin family protein